MSHVGPGAPSAMEMPTQELPPTSFHVDSLHGKLMSRGVQGSAQCLVVLFEAL